MHSLLRLTIPSGAAPLLLLAFAAACNQNPGDEHHGEPVPRTEQVRPPERPAAPAAPGAPQRPASPPAEIAILNADGEVAFDDVRTQTEQLIRYYESIELTPEQERVKAEALQPLPAPCCANFSALTCCCECNLSRSVWGLSHYLITQGKDATEVRDSVQRWLAFVSPSGHSGESCFNGGCGRPFSRDGCGGMDADHVVYDG